MSESVVTKAINRSGFPLQMALEHQVKTNKTGWRILAHEHHWKNSRTGEEGWVDLVLYKRYAAMVIECKRVHEGKWVFLADSARREVQFRCRTIRTRFDEVPGSGHSGIMTDVQEVALDPASYQVEYCINAGEGGSTGRELLERTAANVLSATEAIAASGEWSPSPKTPNFHFFTAIVTTAELNAAFVDCKGISLADGSVTDAHAQVEQVNHVRFVKQLWSGVDYPVLASEAREFGDSGKAKVHTVLVINALHFVEFLRRFEPNGEDWMD